MAENTAGQTRHRSDPTRHTQITTGSVAYDDTTIVAGDYTEVQVGYRARHVVWSNATDRIQLEWFEGMADDSCIKTAADGVRTLVTSGGITVTDGAVRVSQNATTGGIKANTDCYWLVSA